ncbi:alpha/beta hydrolase [Streptomyces himastatinicus ATCC 53653]|uniref:Alpha/beta hydrolase n=1 Tax=Streptomyces himastatinicus ATCC 53653 TaxID=457427 RepID=D9WGX2_9ACTN|nr:alpha/beta fold hydrolase [Streptomyces himastatinicus]EFL27452.1 alpha/beta hydrolase [Streptomyces himastatinicus ATCC 53653]
MLDRRDVAFTAKGGVTLRGWYFVPEGEGPHPAISMAHGYAGVKEHALEGFARRFADAGFAVLLHDHRTFGASDGEPRQDVNPWEQAEDWRRAISFLEAQHEVDPGRIGVWGSSYAGGHAIVLGATDRRLKAVVAQVPTISGYQQALRRVPPHLVPALEEGFAEEERRSARGEPLDYQQIVSADPAVRASYYSSDAVDFYLQELPDGVWENRVTVRSTRMARMYEPGLFIRRVSPTPLLMIVAEDDYLTVTDVALEAYEDALEPKKLILIPGGHFDPYRAQFEHASTKALEWFRKHLQA